jgi:hypothetical protein
MCIIYLHGTTIHSIICHVILISKNENIMGKKLISSYIFVLVFFFLEKWSRLN